MSEQDYGTDAPKLASVKMGNEGHTHYFRPAVQSVYEHEHEVMRDCIAIQRELERISFAGTRLTILAYLLEMEPTVEIAVVKSRYLRPAIQREAAMVTWSGVKPEKVWPLMANETHREEITSTINILSCLRRQGIHHEGLEAAFTSWVRKNK